MNYLNIVWDMGGTLMDTYPSVDAMLARVAGAHGLEVDPAEVTRLTRTSIASAIEALAERAGVARDPFDRAYADLKESWVGDPPPVMEGAREVMDRIRGAGGLNLVVTHRDRTSAEDLLRASGLVVDDMVCAPDGHPRKPDPTMYRTIVGRHGLVPQQCLAVGDRPIDGRAARAAGLDTARLETPGIHLEPEDTYTINRLEELHAILGG